MKGWIPALLLLAMPVLVSPVAGAEGHKPSLKAKAGNHAGKAARHRSTMRENEPMQTGMMKPGMKKGDVRKHALEKEQLMREEMKREEQSTLTRDRASRAVSGSER